jgi:hypothetical protein
MKAIFIVIGRLGRPEGRVAHHVRRGALAEQQVVHQLGDRDEAAAIVAEIDDHLVDALRLELRKGAAQGRIGWADEGAQVHISDLLAIIVDNPRAVAR